MNKSMKILENTNEFQCDYENLYAKTNKVLINKSETINCTNDDYIRTRMKHILEVTQISRAIAKGLNLNVNLTKTTVLPQDLENTLFCDLEQLYPEYGHSTTLEGQIVAIAEEISQRGHNLIIKFSSDSLNCKELSKYENLRKITILKSEIANIDNQIKLAHQKNIEYIAVTELQHSIIEASIIGFFINDVINCSKDKIEKFIEDDFYKECHRFSKLLLSFSDEGKILII
ncbi:MAG: hypothetical protein CVU84_07815 [Firmicutes bacterium HGW-Firmicutes-1]|jgi:dGTPase|nr:MAG: hypothetical protein CVU84_07815 [Firmicutes bacterium HGW-Firmicutes-1]